jgi:hypothetical protein
MRANTGRGVGCKQGMEAMALELKKVLPVELRSVGLNEKWLQEQIKSDTTILGLGELEIVGKEHRQPSGGRIDFLMHHADTDLFYEVEIMLGVLDESHIIRTIEYWDVERQRRPQSDHRAVIVAENITSRFFNVLRLLNRSVPMIAVQLSAFKLDDDSIALHAVTVLDVVEEIAEAYVEEEAEETDRIYWEKKRDPASLSVMDKIASALKATGIEQKLAYNKHHIALRSTGNNYCWFHPRKTPGYCHVEFKLSADTRDPALAVMQDAGIDASSRGAARITFSITNMAIDAHLGTIVGELKKAEELSR